MEKLENVKRNIPLIESFFVRFFVACNFLLFSQVTYSDYALSKEELIKTKAAAFVLDANSGQILHNYLGTELRHPASLTKMMTLYLAFEAIKSDHLSLSSQLLISERAVAVAPSKLGLIPGSKISLENAIKALIVKSANDMAVAIAESISGSEIAFARLMTLKAREIGMKKTVFKNASGLPNKSQVTTAQDMVTLGLRLQQDYSDFYKLFSLQSFTFDGKTYQSHNTLLSSFEGVDGIKTGYTRMSGFNIVSSYNSNGKKIIGAVFGGISASARDAHMRMLLALALEKASNEKNLIKNWETNLTSQNLDEKKEIQIKQMASPQSMGPYEKGSILSQKKEIDNTLLNSTLKRENERGVKLNTDVNIPTQDDVQSNKKSRAVQIGIFKNLENAERALSLAKIKVSRLLKDHPSQIIPVNKENGLLFMARFNNFQDSKAAKTCQELRQVNIECMIIETQ